MYQSNYQAFDQKTDMIRWLRQ